MIVLNERAIQIYLKSCILAAGGEHLKYLLENWWKPVEVQRTNIGAWETTIKRKSKVSNYIESQYIFCLEEDDQYKNTIYDWEVHYDFNDIKREMIGYLTETCEEIELSKMNKNDLCECFWNTLFDKLSRYKFEKSKYSIHMELWAKTLFCIDEDMEFYFPSIEQIRNIDNLCDEIKFLPSSHIEIPIPKTFPGGIVFQQTKEEFYKKILK